MKIFLITLLTLTSCNAWSQQTLGVFFNFPESFNGYTLIQGSGSDSVYLVDNCGYQVHHWVTEGGPGLATYLLENGDLVRTGKVTSSIYSGGGSGGLVQKWSWDGDLLWNYQVSDDTIHQHHDVQPMPNGNILVLSWGYLSNSQSIMNGRDPLTLNNELWPTVIQELEPIGLNEAQIIWQWSVADHFVQDFDSTQLNYGIIADHPELLDINYSSNGSADFLHCNAINYNANHDLIVISSRKSSEIYVIDHSTTTIEAASHSGGNRGIGGDFLYRWGNPQIYDRGIPDDQMLLGPHDIHWIPDSLSDGGKFMVFNNVGGTLGSAVNVFDPQMDVNGDFPNPGTDAYGPINVDWHYEEDNFSSGTISGAQRLPNGNTLICEGSSGHLFELTPNGNKVWDYVNPSSTSGNLVQGSNPIQNAMFRTTRFPVDFPAFIGKDLTSGSLIEIDPDPGPCAIEFEPTAIENLITPEKFSISISYSQSNDVLHITTKNHDGQLKIELFNSLGVLIYNQDTHNLDSRINLDRFSVGLYIISAYSYINKERAIQKFVNK